MQRRVCRWYASAWQAQKARSAPFLSLPRRWAHFRSTAPHGKPCGAPERDPGLEKGLGNDMKKLIFAIVVAATAATAIATAQAADRKAEARWVSSVHACLLKEGIDINKEGRPLLIVRTRRGLRLVAAPSATTVQKARGRNCLQKANAIASLPGTRVRVRMR